MNYTVAWVVVGVMGLLGTLGLFFLTRSIGHAGLRWVLRLLPLLLMVAPAPVPNYDGHVAPAFIVFAFETLFQTEGESLPALIILIAAIVIGVLAGLLLGRVSSREPTEEAKGN